MVDTPPLKQQGADGGGRVCRPDGHQNNLRSAAYESLMEIVKNSAKDCYPAVQRTTLVIMERLQQVLQMEVSGEEATPTLTTPVWA